MSLGTIARSILGPRFHDVARLYRAVFVNLDAVAETVSEYLPQGALVLDVGGGDGAPLNHLLDKRPDLRVVMLDLSKAVGGAVDEKYAHRVTRLPQTHLADYTGARPDAVLIMDVIHHVPHGQRTAFFRDLGKLVRRNFIGCVIVKDIEPRGFRAWLSLMADKYISGDRQVLLIPSDGVRVYLEMVGKFQFTKTRLYDLDAPNYGLVAQRV